VDFTEGFENNSLLHDKILEAYSNLIVVKSISKSYGVPGLRLGIMASSNEELINEIKKDVAIWNINSIAEFYMQIYNKYDATYKYACRKFQVERANFYEKLKAIPYLRIIPSQANFFLCEVVDKYTSSELTKLLMLQFNILIKDCKNKNALKEKNYIRIAIRNEYDNDILIDALKQL
jgi:histidinol-phosphate/aromatic aminotransferase/cobyric acid decarboxylase-like protein